MATEADIAKEVEDISEVWGNPAARNGLFGNILKSVHVEAVRGMAANLEFSWPVTAIAGTNGSGKTTILQLCSAAYIKPGGGRNYKIGDWVRTALKDETPAFGAESSVTFSFWNDAPVLPIPYRKDRTRWDYPRRNNPERLVQFGFAHAVGVHCEVDEQLTSLGTFELRRTIDFHRAQHPHEDRGIADVGNRCRQVGIAVRVTADSCGAIGTRGSRRV